MGTNGQVWKVDVCGQRIRFREADVPTRFCSACNTTHTCLRPKWINQCTAHSSAVLNLQHLLPSEHQEPPHCWIHTLLTNVQAAPKSLGSSLEENQLTQLCHPRPFGISMQSSRPPSPTRNDKTCPNHTYSRTGEYLKRAFFMFSQTQQNTTSNQHIPSESLWNAAHTEPVCKHLGYNPGRLVGGVWWC